MHRNTIRTTTLSWQTPRMPFLSSFCLCVLQSKRRALTLEALKGVLGAHLLILAPALFVKVEKKSVLLPWLLQSHIRVYWPACAVNRLIRAAETQHNNRKFWVIGSILRSDPQLFDWFSFNWLSSATWHHQSFRLEVREMKWLYNTISMIRHLHFRNILKCDRNHRPVRMLLS